MNPVVEVKDLFKHYQVRSSFWGGKDHVLQAVAGVNLTIMPGEILGLVGESGCGKSTLGRLILKLEEPASGQVFYKGRDVSSLSQRQMRNLRRDMQIIFQDPYSSLNPRRNIFDIVAEPFVIHKLCRSRTELVEKVTHILGEVGIGEGQLYRYPHEFSGGQRQRIGIARALALHPEFIVADEPVSSLDVSIQAQVINLLLDLKNKFNLTYLFIAHDLQVVHYLSTRIAVMYLGKIVEIIDKNILGQVPHHPYTEALLAAAPYPDPTRRQRRIILEGDPPSPLNIPPGCPFHPRCPYRKDICTTDKPLWHEASQRQWLSCHIR